MDELKKIPSKVNLELFDISTFTPQKIREIFRGGKLPTAEAMADEIVLRAIRSGSTEVHIEPRDTELLVRLVSDGLFRRLVSLPREITENIITALKNKTGLNQDEKRISQEGGYTVSLAGLSFDIRMSTLPTSSGERVSLRILRKRDGPAKIDELGLSGENSEKLLRLIHRSSGLILSAGPTGSGESTVVRACLAEIAGPDRNIITMEERIEHRLEFASQVRTSPAPGSTPAEVFRLVLRHNPSVIMLSEVRDLESGMIAADAVQSGILVFSTILARNAIGTIIRLRDFGLSPYWVATTLAGVVHQKLIRKICSECMVSYQPTPEELAFMGKAGSGTFYQGKGCPACDGTGYRESTGIHEILTVDDRLRDLILREANFLQLKEAAQASGFEDIRTDATMKARAGLTTPQEILRVLE